MSETLSALHVPPGDGAAPAPPPTVAHTAAPVVSPEVATTCLDCGASRLGAYCHECGQHHQDDRLTIRMILREFAERFLKFERGLLPTARLALVDPGRLAREYVGGRRRRYVNPVSFLLVGSAVAVLMMPLYASVDRFEADPSASWMGSPETQAATGFDAAVRMSGRDPASIPAEVRDEAIAEAAAMQAEFLTTYLETVNRLYSVFSVALVLAIALCLKLFFAGRQPSYTFAETLVLGCFIAGIYMVVSSVIASALATVAPVTVGSIVTSVGLVAMMTWAATGFYDRTWAAAALGGLSGLVALMLYVVAIVAIAFPIVLVRVL